MAVHGVGVLVVELDRVGDVEIQPAVGVVVAKGCAHRPAAVSHPGRGGHVLEGTVPVVAVEGVGAVVAHEQVHPAVVVVVAGGHSHTPAAIPDSCLVGHVGKSPVAVVAVEGVGNRALSLNQLLPVASVDQVEIHPAVPVEVDPGHPSAHALQDVLLLRAAAEVLKIQARFGGHVLKDQRGRGRQRFVRAGQVVGGRPRQRSQASNQA